MKRSTAVFATLVAVGSAWVGTGDVADARGSADAREYWNRERILGAQPRDVVLADRPEHAQPQARPGGGGGTTGASWTGNEFVRRTTGKVFFTLDGVNYVCSGSTVKDANSGLSLVLTAGHCVEDGAGGGFASKFVYVPDYERWATKSCTSDPGRCFPASRLVTTSAWANAGDFNYDVAFAVVDGGTLEQTWASQDIGFNLARGQTTYAFGYPAAGKYKGNKLIYCSGTVSADRFGSLDQGLGCNMTGGSSGGPWFFAFNPTTAVGTANSLNSFKYVGDNSTMYGPYFGNYAQATYDAARAGGSGNAAVAAPAVLP